MTCTIRSPLALRSTENHWHLWGNELVSIGHRMKVRDFCFLFLSQQWLEELLKTQIVLLWASSSSNTVLCVVSGAQHPLSVSYCSRGTTTLSPLVLKGCLSFFPNAPTMISRSKDDLFGGKEVYWCVLLHSVAHYTCPTFRLGVCSLRLKPNSFTKCKMKPLEYLWFSLPIIF